jgi:hypothetical protein
MSMLKQHSARETLRRMSRLVAAGAVVAAAGGVWVGVANAASASPATSGTEHFYLMTTSGTATTIPLIANGVFTASGVDHEGNTVDTAAFTNGTFKITHSGGVGGAPKVNPHTCFFTFTGKGKFTVGHGTGAYKGISGSGRVVISIVGILGRTHSGACSENGKPVAWQQSYKATASIKL